MNTMWSTCIQGIGTLYESRKLRFSDIFRDKYMPFWDFHNEAKICEIGCGPGALTESLHRWYPDAEIYGVDRDSNFIAFASEWYPYFGAKISAEGFITVGMEVY